jgi:phage shock protein PspC (stress-responsive transcriptional regulator)
LVFDRRFKTGESGGAPTPLARPAAAPRPLMLDKRNKKIAGVCAGFARHLEMDVTLVRVLWLLIVFAGGVGFLGYLAAWIVMPSDHGRQAG